ncbi:hypothetical protein BDR03DRAFT_958888 [Suillus americanus]|nr:hypothetical protein BDR03DRAFT_958888 [Suillus americanus]
MGSRRSFRSGPLSGRRYSKVCFQSDSRHWLSSLKKPSAVLFPGRGVGQPDSIHACAGNMIILFLFQLLSHDGIFTDRIKMHVY